MGARPAPRTPNAAALVRPAFPLPQFRGRGAGGTHANPANRFERSHHQIERETLDHDLADHRVPSQPPTRANADRARSLINPVDSPDLPMRWTVNPYRGCEHGCIYCYARPGHEYFGLSCGLDFETKVFVKYDAPRLFREEIASVRWRGEPISFSGVTDCYQPLEAKLQITRECLKIASDCHQPISIVTKSALVTRDIDVLAPLAILHAASVAVSVTTLDPALSAKMEPRAASPASRLRAIRELADAGIPVTVMVAPIIPGLNDAELPQILEAASAAGATGAGYVLLRLPYQVKTLFLDWLQRHMPDRAARIESLIRQTREGELYNASFGPRLKGQGPIAQTLATAFRVFCAKHHLNREWPALSSKHFQRPSHTPGQLGLFTSSA